MIATEKKHLLDVMDELMAEIRKLANRDNEPQLIRAVARVSEAADIVDHLEAA